MLDSRGERNAGIHRKVPNGTTEAEPVDQVERDGHVVGIDSDDLIMDLRIIDMASGEIDLVASTPNAIMGAL